MELRNHPLMRRGSVRNWPPVWSAIAGGIRAITGEIGVLKSVSYYDFSPLRCRLTIEHQGEDFMGTLLFDDASVCWLIADLLKKHTRSSIKDIGGLDVSYSL
jgi:hypothetical protein